MIRDATSPRLPNDVPPATSDEVEHALEKERQSGKIVLFPIRIDDAVMQTETDWSAAIKRRRHITDFSWWKEHDAYKTAFDRLMRDLKQEDRKRPKPA